MTNKYTHTVFDVLELFFNFNCAQTTQSPYIYTYDVLVNIVCALRAQHLPFYLYINQFIFCVPLLRLRLSLPVHAEIVTSIFFQLAFFVIQFFFRLFRLSFLPFLFCLPFCHAQYKTQASKVHTCKQILLGALGAAWNKIWRVGGKTVFQEKCKREKERERVHVNV